jgi:hypothetical protein
VWTRLWTRLVVFFSRLRFAWARRRLDEEARSEFEAHLELLVERYVRSGMTPQQATAAARRRFGNVVQAREALYEMNSLGWLEASFQDLRYALRLLRRSPGFSAVVVATFGLGIGGTTAVFSVVRAVWVAPLPYEQPGRLVRLYQQEVDKPSTRHYLSAPYFKLVRDHAASFESVAALDTYSETGLDLVKGGRGQRLRVLYVSSDYFRTLRSGALRGPGFEPGDEAGARRVVVSDRLWRTRLAADSAILGATIQLSAQAYEVVGIAPPGFARDHESAPPRAVVSVNFARHAFPDMSLESVIGQHIAPLGRKREIVGVVGDVALDVYGAPTLTVYHAHRQFAADRNWTLSYVAATSLPPERLLASVSAAVAALDPELVVHRPASMTEVVGRGKSRERFALVLLGAFASVGLTLAALGLYGVLAYAVRQRTQEIGIRIALGATAGQIRALVLRQAGRALAIGLAVGVAGSLLLGRFLSSLAFGVSPSDARILLAAAVLLTATGVVAAWLPARRASRLDPRTAIQD